jgi:hypothetical protein
MFRVVRARDRFAAFFFAIMRLSLLNRGRQGSSSSRLHALRGSAADGSGLPIPRSSDVHCGPPGLRSLDAGCAFGILPPLASNADSAGMGDPERAMLAHKNHVRV